VFLVAQGIADQAVSYAEKFLGDSCVAVNLLEEAAANRFGSDSDQRSRADRLLFGDVRRYPLSGLLAEGSRRKKETRPHSKRSASGIPIPTVIAMATVWIAVYFWTRFWVISTALRER